MKIKNKWKRVCWRKKSIVIKFDNFEKGKYFVKLGNDEFEAQKPTFKVCSPKKISVYVKCEGQGKLECKAK